MASQQSREHAKRLLDPFVGRLATADGWAALESALADGLDKASLRVVKGSYVVSYPFGQNAAERESNFDRARQIVNVLADAPPGFKLAPLDE